MYTSCNIINVLHEAQIRLHIFFLKNGIPYAWLAHDFHCKFHWGIHCLCESYLVWYRFKKTKELFMAVSSVKSVQYLSFQQWNCVCSNWTSRSVGMQIAEDQEWKLYAKIKFVNLCGGPLCYFMTLYLSKVSFTVRGDEVKDIWILCICARCHLQSEEMR